jgi:acyl carrier protein
MSIEKLIADHLQKDLSEITDDKNLIEDLGADSLDTVEMILQLEEEYDIEIPDEDAETLDTVGKIKQYIEDYS